MTYRYTLSITLLLAGLGLTLAGCGGGTTSSESAALRVYITDKSIEGVQSIILAISEIRVVPSGNESQGTSAMRGIAAFSPPRVVDVMQLQFQQQVLGEASVPSGEYSQVRLVLAANVTGQEPVNYVTYTADPSQRVALRTPSGQESGLKVLGRFAVEPGRINVIVLDFDPAQSIVQAGPNLNLKPTGIRIVQTDQTLASFGALTGTVSPSEARDTAFVSIIPQGQTQAIARGTVNPETGDFRAMLPTGVYYVRAQALGFFEYNGSLLLPPRLSSVSVGHDTAGGDFHLTATN